jgi:hypothetical protein
MIKLATLVGALLASMITPTIASAAPAAPAWLGVYFVRTDNGYGQRIDTYCTGSASFTNRSSGVWYQKGGKWMCDGFQWRTGSAGTFHRWGSFTYRSSDSTGVQGDFVEEMGWGKQLANGTQPPAWLNVYYARTDNAYGQKIDTYCFGNVAFSDRPSGVWIGSIYGWYCQGFQWSSGYSGTFHRKGLFNYSATKFFEKSEWSPKLA